jgi:broad specificity phosphatase PhoE
MAARHWDLFTGTSAPYEQMADVLRRALRFVARVRREYPNGESVAVTHGDVVACLILWAKGVAPTVANKLQLASMGLPDGYPAPASVTTLVWEPSAESALPRVEYLSPH